LSLLSELRRRNVFRVAAAYLVVGWLLTEVASTLLPMFGAPDWVARSLVMVIALGFVPVMIFCWAYELTPDGLKRESEVNRDESITWQTGRKLDLVTIAAVVAGITFLAWSRLSPEVGSPVQAVTMNAVAPVDASVAVLPFVNMSGNAENEYFSDGLTETLLHMLAQVPELRVAARTSSFAFKGQEKDIREIAAALSVAHVLEGSVQRSGDRVRITAQLIRATDGFHVWSENYDRTLDDIFGIQDEIAGKVGGALSDSLLGIRDKPIDGIATRNISAYDLYLKALAERAKGSYGSLQDGAGFLKDALSKDPDFLDAKSALAKNYLDQMLTGLMTPDVAIPSIEALAGQVLAERPGDPATIPTLTWAQAYHDYFAGNLGVLQTALDTLQTLVDVAPGEVEPRVVLARFLMFTDRLEESMQQLQAAQELDPLNPQVYYEIGIVGINGRDFDVARAALVRSLELEPSQPNAYDMLGRIAARTGDGLGSLKMSLKALQVDPKDHELPAFVAQELYELGLIDEGDRFRARVRAIAPTSEVAMQTELLRSINADSEEASLLLARQIVETYTVNRQGVWTDAAEYVLWTMTRRGEAQSALDYFDEQVPGFSDFDAPDIPQRVLAARRRALAAWQQTVPHDELMRRIELAYAPFIATGFKFSDVPPANVSVLALSGDTDAAIDVALSEYFTRAVNEFPGWRRFLAQPHLAGVVADPRVQEEMARWEREEAGLREELRAFLANYHNEARSL
jgi:TolB-like protein